MLTFSGEIYNFTELRQELIAHGHAFVTRSDAEGLAEPFSQIGTKTPGHDIYRSLAELRPGTITVADRDGLHTSAYWALESVRHTDGLIATAQTVGELLADVVHRQTVADVPLCSLLSGGLDSSVVPALAAGSLGRDRERAAAQSGVTIR